MERVRAKPKHSPHFTYRAVPALKIRSCNGFCQIRQPSAENSVCNYVLAASSDDRLWRKRHFKPGSVLAEQVPVVERFRRVLRRHGGDLHKLITGYPRKFDLKDEIAFLKKLGDAFGNDPQHDSWPVSSEYIHVEAFRIAWWYFALPIAHPILRRESEKVRRRAPISFEELVEEVKNLCQKLWEEIDSEPRDSRASNEVLANLFKLFLVEHVKREDNLAAMQMFEVLRSSNAALRGRYGELSKPRAGPFE